VLLTAALSIGDTRSGKLRGDGGQAPFAGHAFERVITSVFELKS
jgi:hypothetical protein